MWKVRVHVPSQYTVRNIDSFFKFQKSEKSWKKRCFHWSIFFSYLHSRFTKNEKPIYVWNIEITNLSKFFIDRNCVSDIDGDSMCYIFRLYSSGKFSGVKNLGCQSHLWFAIYIQWIEWIWKLLASRYGFIQRVGAHVFPQKSIKCSCIENTGASFEILHNFVCLSIVWDGKSMIWIESLTFSQYQYILIVRFKPNVFMYQIMFWYVDMVICVK